MHTFVKKINVENASEGTHSNKNGLASAVKRVLDLLSVCSSHSHWRMFRQKETPIGYNASITLNYRNVAEILRLLHSKMLSIFGSTEAKFVNGHFLQCRVSNHASVRVLQTVTYNPNFIVLLLLSSRISQNWSAPDSIECFINGRISRIIYFNKCNHLDIIIFRL